MVDRGTVNVCFHGVGAPARSLEPGEDAYWVTEDRFEDILDAIVDRPRVVISFDDGNASDVAIALPALARRGLTARFFVLAGRLGQPGSLDDDGVRALRRAGMVIGTHGMDHRPWRGMDEATRRAELVEARARISAVAGTPVTEAACPLGRYDRTLLGLLRRLGYERVHTSDRRRARSGAWIQPRYSMLHSDDGDSVRRSVLEPPPAIESARLAAVGLVKRWR